MQRAVPNILLNFLKHNIIQKIKKLQKTLITIQSISGIVRCSFRMNFNFKIIRASHQSRGRHQQEKKKYSRRDQGGRGCISLSRQQRLYPVFIGLAAAPR